MGRSPEAMRQLGRLTGPEHTGVLGGSHPGDEDTERGEAFELGSL